MQLEGRGDVRFDDAARHELRINHGTVRCMRVLGPQRLGMSIVAIRELRCRAWCLCNNRVGFGWPSVCDNCGSASAFAAMF